MIFLNRKNLSFFIFAMSFIRRLLIFQFFRHAEFISASLRLKEVLKQVQDDEAIFAFFIPTLYQYFSLKEPFAITFLYGHFPNGVF